MSVRRRIRWRPRPGQIEDVTGPAASTRLSANVAAIRLAILAGYTSPRWYQWWRWGERPLIRKGDGDQDGS